MILDYANLPRQLETFIDRSGEFRTREWADANITAQRSSARLNEIFKSFSAEKGRPWTVDLAPMCWRYVPSYLRPEDGARLQPAIDALARDYGVKLKTFEYRRTA
jgi:hypothetical protein